MSRTTVKIGDKLFDRIAYGKEKTDWGADTQPCRHCEVEKGELHIIGCLVERCPRCGGQLMSCACPYDVDFTRRPISSIQQAFYKLFYLAVIPSALLVSLNLLAELGIPIWGLAVIPVLLSVAFWRKMGRMELAQVVACPPPKDIDIEGS